MLAQGDSKVNEQCTQGYATAAHAHKQTNALCLDLSVLTEMCVDIRRESRRAEYTLRRAKQKCGGDGGEKKHSS